TRSQRSDGIMARHSRHHRGLGVDIERIIRRICRRPRRTPRPRCDGAQYSGESNYARVHPRLGE
ncbi:hypothetical protein HK405_002075, partial [Cladochytrium tenue]